MRRDALQPEAVAVGLLREVITRVDEGLLLPGLRVHWVHLRLTFVVLGVLHVDGDEGAVDQPVGPEKDGLLVVQVEVLHRHRDQARPAVGWAQRRTVGGTSRADGAGLTASWRRGEQQ